jgi:hypothetical protein
VHKADAYPIENPSNFASTCKRWGLVKTNEPIHDHSGFNEVMTTEELQYEQTLFEEGASHFHNFIAVGGTLKLTDRRLLFTSCAKNQYKHQITIRLNQVKGVEFFKTLFTNPNGLALLLSDGQVENFIVDDKKMWKSRIEKVLVQVA